MKSYNKSNYDRYKDDIYDTKVTSFRDGVIVKHLYLVEKIARKFSTSQIASGVLSIEDIIQEGNLGLIRSVDKVDWDKVKESENAEKTLKSFLSKRIKGAIRRAIDINRGSIKIPEYKLNEIRKNPEDNKLLVGEFFNSIFLDIDNNKELANTTFEDALDLSTSENKIELLSTELLKIMNNTLNKREVDILVCSFGIGTKKLSAKSIANKIGLKGNTAYVRISEIKKRSIQKLIDNIEYEQVVEFL